MKSPIRFRSVLLFVASATLAYSQTPTFAGCPIFPADNVWNTRIDNLPVDPNSSLYVVSMNATNPKLHPDFGHGGGMPYNVVPGSQPKYPVSFYYNGDAGPYPIPANVNIETGSDHHAILIDNANCVLYELFNLSGSGSTWKAGSGAIWSLDSNALRPDGWTSADAAGLPITPGLVRYDEVAAGVIKHAIRFTADHTCNAHIWPARHDASYLTGGQYPPMGERFRLKASFDITPYPQPVQIILQAMKTYGIILADNGTSWFFDGLGDTRWNDDVMHSITNVTGDNFEAVDESSLMIDPNSAETSIAVPSVPTGWVNIVSHNSGKCFDIHGGPSATQIDTIVQQFTCLGTPQTNQHFRFVDQGNGQYEIEVQNSGLGVEVSGAINAGDGQPLIQNNYGGKFYENWTLTPTSDGFWIIKRASNGFCAATLNKSKDDGAPIVQWPCTGTDNQKWSFAPVQQ